MKHHVIQYRPFAGVVQVECAGDSGGLRGVALKEPVVLSWASRGAGLDRDGAVVSRIVARDRLPPAAAPISLSIRIGLQRRGVCDGLAWSSSPRWERKNKS